MSLQEKLELIFGTICLVILFIDSEPLILLKRFLGFKEEEYDNMTKTKQFFHKLVYCAMCSGFWIGLTVAVKYIGYTYSGLIIAAIISIGSGWLHNKLNE